MQPRKAWTVVQANVTSQKHMQLHYYFIYLLWYLLLVKLKRFNPNI